MNIIIKSGNIVLFLESIISNKISIVLTEVMRMRNKKVDVETLKKLDWLISNPEASNKEFGAVFNCHPNNATNLRARYPKIISGEIKLEDVQNAIIFEQESRESECEALGSESGLQSSFTRDISFLLDEWYQIKTYFRKGTRPAQQLAIINFEKHLKEAL